MHSISFGIHHRSIAIEDKWIQVTTTNVHKIAIDVAEKICFLCYKDRFLATFDCPAYQGSHLPTLTHACLVANNHSLPLFHLVYGHSHTIHLFGSKGLVGFLYGCIVKLASYELIYSSVFLFYIGEYLVHGLNHGSWCNALQAER